MGYRSPSFHVALAIGRSSLSESCQAVNPIWQHELAQSKSSLSSNTRWLLIDSYGGGEFYTAIRTASASAAAMPLEMPIDVTCDWWAFDGRHEISRDLRPTQPWLPDGQVASGACGPPR